MTIKEAKEYFRERLFAIYPHSEIIALERIVFNEIFAIAPAEIALANHEIINIRQEIKLTDIVSKLEQEIPVQYILGYADFYDLKLTVNKNTLIPRPETEELIDWIIKENNSSSDINILDIGTGSGCIILSLAKNLLNVRCFATDISKNALGVAQLNAERSDLNISFCAHNILKNGTNPFPQNYDIIVSNPPYVLQSEKAKMQKNVLDYEPEIALFVEDSDALIYYKTIVSKAKEWLKPNGKLYFEINEQKGKEIYQLLDMFGYKKIEVKKDLNLKDRMVRGILN